MECTHSYCVFKINFLEESNKKILYQIFFLFFFHMKYFIFYSIFNDSFNNKFEIFYYVKIFETIIKIMKFLK